MFPPFSYNWKDSRSRSRDAAALQPSDEDRPLGKKRLETSSYSSTVEYLKVTFEVPVYAVGNGNHLIRGQLFHNTIWTLRRENPLEHGQDVFMIQKASGRPDLVILLEDYVQQAIDSDRKPEIRLDMVTVLIEIKTDETIKETGLCAFIALCSYHHEF